jgi:hypothetical protein
MPFDPTYAANGVPRVEEFPVSQKSFHDSASRLPNKKDHDTIGLSSFRSNPGQASRLSLNPLTVEQLPKQFRRQLRQVLSGRAKE